jgi:hypothetical protein
MQIYIILQKLLELEKSFQETTWSVITEGITEV